MSGMEPVRDRRIPDIHPFALPQDTDPDYSSCLPPGSVARIWKPARSAMTSGRARENVWKLQIERASPPWTEPLMGWTADDDAAHLVEIEFPNLDAAIRHAKRLGVAYEVRLPPARKRT